MAISKEVLIAQRNKAMEKGYLTKSERETFEKYIGRSVETNPTHLRDRRTQNRSTRKRSTNTASKVYDVVSKTPVDEYQPVGGREVEGYQIDKEPTIESGFDTSKLIMYGLGFFLFMGLFGN